jgi:hypothetical protein
LPSFLVEPMTSAASGAAGAVVAAVSAALYFMGSGRSLDYDSSLTVGGFVKTSSLLDPLRRQSQLNNHPLFSLLEHIVWSSGFHTETYLRVLPITFGALTVALLTAWCARQWGLLAGVSAGVVLAANPMFADLSRAVRGYSLLTFCALASTLLLWRLLEATPADRRTEVLYVVFVAAGISTHLYGCVVLVVHAAMVIARREFNATWFRRWVASLFLGSLIYLKTINIILNTRNHRQFRSGYGGSVALAIFGQARVAAIALFVVVVVALWLTRRNREFVIGAAALVVFVIFVWVIVEPQFLVVRYWVWVIPGVGLATAFLVARRPAAIVLVVVAVVAMAIHERPMWTATEDPTSEAAAVLDAARAEGMEVCGYMHTGVGVLAYTRQPAVKVSTVQQITQCQFLIGFYVPASFARVARREFPYAWQIPGEFPGFVYSRKPEAAVLAARTHRRDTLDTHPRVGAL